MFRSLINENLSVQVGSKEYKDFVQILENEVGKDPKQSTCLTCWQFISHHQKKIHEAYGHHCLTPKSIKDEASYIHYARLYHHVTWDGIILLIKP